MTTTPEPEETPLPEAVEYAYHYWGDEDELVFTTSGCGCCSESYRCDMTDPDERDTALRGLHAMHKGLLSQAEEVRAYIEELEA